MVSLTKPDALVRNEVDVNIVAVAELVHVPIDIVACDVTMPMNIKTSEIMMPIDVQSSYIALPVDLQAQYIDLAVKIVAQTVNVEIEINAQNVGVKIESEWQSFQGNEKDQFKESINLAWSDSFVTVDYAPPEGKDLYITGMAFAIYPAAADDYDHHLRGEAVLFCGYLGNEISPIGGEGGGGITFPTPIKIPSQKNVSVRGTNWSNVTCKMHIGWWGYET